jgi:nucleoside-diphosphate-sugar epimerase
MTTRYLVTGAQGFVGSFLVAHLLTTECDASVLGIGRSPANALHFTHAVHWGAQTVPAALPAEVKSKRDGRYRYEIADLQDRRALESLLRSFRPDVIMHMASGLRDDALEHLFRTNVEGTAHLIEAVAAAKIPVRRIVFGSSGAIYGSSALDRLPLDEQAPCMPMDLYSASKLASENVSRIMTDRYGIPAVWARIFNIVGPGQEERHFCGRVAAQSAAIKFGLLPKKIEVGDLTPTRDFIDVRDVAVALAMLAANGKSGFAYNVASGNETPMSRVLDLALEISGLSGQVAIENTYRRAADIARAFAGIDRLTDLGFAPRFDLRQSMADLIDYYCTTVRSEAESV